MELFELLSGSRRPGQSWRTFLHNQAMAFSQYSEEQSREYADLRGQSDWAELMGSAATQIAAVGVGLWRRFGRQQPALKARRISLRSARCERAAMHRVQRLAAVSGDLQKLRSNRIPVFVSVRSAPYQARASPGPQL